MNGITLIEGDCKQMLRDLPAASVHCCITSPPYFGLRDYGVEGQLGLESTPEEYVQRLVEVFRDVRRVLRDDGTLWLNLGDSYNSAASGQNGQSGTLAGGKPCGGNGTTSGRRPLYAILKPKDLIGIPWRVAFALQADGWYLRQDIIWHKPNPMPESVTDRCTKAHEYVFLLSKSERYFFDADAMKEPAVQAGRVRSDKMGGNKGDEVNHSPGSTFTGSETRNRRSVWTVATQPYSGAHFATFPQTLIEPMVLAGCPEGGVVLDPFNGAGTTGLVALRNRRAYIGIELNAEYLELTRQRLAQVAVKLF